MAYIKMRRFANFNSIGSPYTSSKTLPITLMDRFTNLSTCRKDCWEKNRLRNLARNVSADSANFYRAFILRSGRDPKIDLVDAPSFYSAKISFVEANENAGRYIAARSSSVKHESGSEILKTMSR